MTKASTETTFVPVPLIGTACAGNKGAFQWSYEKLACLASGSEVFIVDTKTLEVIQVLAGHSSTVTHVLWLPAGRQFVSAESKLSNRDIISVDSNNQLIVWDALKGQQIGSFMHTEGSSRQILDIQIPHGSDLWVRTKVYILYSGNVLAVYDYVHGTTQFVQIANPNLENLGATDHFVRFASDPYHSNQYGNSFAFLGWDGVNSAMSVSVCKFWDSMKDTKIVIHKRISLTGKNSFGNATAALNNSPSSMGRSTSSSSLSSASLENSNNANNLNNKRPMTSSSSIRKLVSDIIVGPDYTTTSSSNAAAAAHLNNGSIIFHPGIKDAIIVCTDASIHLVNIHFMTVLHTFSIEKQAVPMVQVIPTKTRPCIYTLHENGTLFLRKYGIIGTHSLAVQLDTICYNENPRFAGKKTEVIGFVIQPLEESSMIVYLNDGRLLKYELVGVECAPVPVDGKRHLTTPSTPYVRSITGFEEHHQQDHQHQDTKKCPSSPSKHCPVLSKTVKSILDLESDSNLLSINLKRVTHAFGQFTCIKSQGDLLVAGTTSGFLVVMKISDHRLKALKKFTTNSSSPINGIEFVSDSEILTYSNLSFSANPKCELVLTEVWTGASRNLKTDENGHIQCVKVSPLKQYCVVVYKNGVRPCELWDLPRRQLIKSLPNKLPPITCAHWRQPLENAKEEIFYMCDIGTFLFTFRVEGNRFVNATCVKLEHTQHIAGIPITLFSRDEMVFRADGNSVVIMYNTVKKTASPSTSIGRGSLLGVVKIPDQDNYVVQFVDCLVLWDFAALKKVKALHTGQLKTTSIAVLKDWVAYVPKGGHGVRLLPLDSSTSIVASTPTISPLTFPYFMNATEKASKILRLVEDESSTVENLSKLTKEFFAKDEHNFWNIVNVKWSNSNNVSCDVDIFCDKQQYKDVLVKTAQSVWATDYHKREEVAKILLWSGESDRAAEILLDTEPSDASTYVTNGLKASICVGSSNLPEQSKAVLKIIATNLIACGDMDGGLELLCLLQKHSEACKYVESTNEWGKALLLCKTALNEKCSKDSLCKYAQFINSKKCAYKAAAVYVYLDKFDRAIEVLFGARLRHLSYLLLHFCLKRGIPLSIGEHIQTAISLDFARFVFECGLQKEAVQFCESLGSKGKDLKQELEILSS